MSQPQVPGPSAQAAMDVDEDILKERNTEIEKVVKAVSIIVEMLGEEQMRVAKSRSVIDLDLSDEISGVLMTVYTALRKAQTINTGGDTYLAHEARIGTVSIPIRDVVGAIKQAGVNFDFKICTPIIELMTLFKPFYDEARTGVTRFRVRRGVLKQTPVKDAKGVLRRKDPKMMENTHNMSQYGLINHHIPLMMGITLPPERRTGVLKSLGPMTQAVLMVMEDKFHNKLTSALEQSLQMIPMCGEIITCLRTAQTPGAVSGVLKELGDILLMTTARSTQKMYFPLLVFLRMYEMMKGDLNKLSFSGSIMMLEYTKLMRRVPLKMRSGGSAIKTSQAVFHGIFGTYLEDLTILEKITTHSGRWCQRRELNDVFTKRSEKPQVTFHGIGFKYISKMAQSLLTKSLGNFEPCATSRPSFSGKRKRKFTAAFQAYINTGKSAQNYSADPMSLQYSLKKMKELLKEDLGSERLLSAGTTDWWEVKGDKLEASEMIPEEGERKFYGSTI